MSIPEAPFDVEAHARKEGSWVQSYSKSMLNEFVELVRSYFAGCKHYYDETVKLVAGLVAEAPADDVPYVRKNKNWVSIDSVLGGGDSVEDLRVIQADKGAVELLPAKHYFVTPVTVYGPHTSFLELILPPTSIRETKITVSPTWESDLDSGMVTAGIILLPPTMDGGNPNDFIYTGEGQGNVAILPMKGTYHLVAVDDVWFVADAVLMGTDAV